MPNNPAFTNHLINEKSPYLLQHAHNPVDWYPWGETAFLKALQEDKPVLLSVGYSTCHWCHVMAHESFESPDIAQLINDSFIAVKVDREERPDIDHIYMSAVTAMTGQGGWPMTVFLTPQGDPFYGGTYFPPIAKWGSIGFTDLLNSIAMTWKKERDKVISSGLSVTESLRRQAAAAPEAGMAMDEGFLDRAFRQMRGQFDEVNGGFGAAPKFPMGHNLSFLLRYYKRRKDPLALDMAGKALTAMAHGGIWDHLGGGFHRYSTDQYWHVPHFEKMLYDQALLSRAYLEAYQVTQSAQFRGIAGEVLDYVLRVMTDPLGGFYSAEDADSSESGGGHLKEGAYYVFSQSEIEEVLGKDSAEIFNFCYGVLPQGNAENDPHGEFTGKNILYRAQSAEDAAVKFHRKSGEIQDILVKSRFELLAFRDHRPRPYLDNKVLCDWNGLMIASFAFAGRVLGEEKYTKAAKKCADFILDQMMANKRLLHRWREGSAGITATLEDHAFFIYGLLDLYEATFEDKYLAAAQSLADDMIRLFSDPGGGFYMTSTDAEGLIIRPKEAYDGAIPSGNSAAALVLLKLSAFIKSETYRSKAEALFNSFAFSISQAPWAFCFLLSALDYHLEGPMDIAFQGKKDDPTVIRMLTVLYKHFIPSKAVMLVPSNKSGQVNICYQGVCKLPIDNLDDFEKEIVKNSHYL
jgi:uncharacterized protein YyaL (SSP411 family)